MTGRERHGTATGAARRRGEMRHSAGDRRVGQIVKARRELATRRVGGHVWLNGREVGGADSRYALEQRSTFQRLMRDEVVDAIEGLTGREVAAFMSNNHIDPDVAVETFMLARQHGTPRPADAPAERPSGWPS